MKTTHTPGPWLPHRYKHVFMGEKLAVVRQGDSRKSLIAEIGPSEFGPSRSECEGNARLIAAAPELLAALEGLTKEIHLGSLHVRKDFSVLVAHAAATKAIADAKGDA